MRRLLAAAATAAIATTALAAPASAASVIPLKCTVSGAAFANPIDNSTGNHDEALVGLQTYQHRIWAGFAWNGRDKYSVLSWHAGQKARIVASFRYPGMETAAHNGGTINAVGVTPAGSIVAGVQAHTKQYSHVAFVFAREHAYKLRTPSTWRSVELLTATAAGRIIGYGVSGSMNAPRYHVVSWSSPTAAPKSIVTLPVNANRPVADARGDIAWQAGPQGTDVVRLATGVTRTLVTSQSSNVSGTLAAAGHYVFADNGKLIRWNLAVPPTGKTFVGTVLTASHLPSEIYAAGANGSALFGYYHRALKVDGHPRVALPPEFDTYGGNEAITAQGGFAYTAKDRLVHFFRCH